ncbi:MAG: peptide ABC transporter substrate-binding protein [Anaerolineales bacterium]|nr:peptide ABC transporter substrate-binding protein [Anaerolineales bacterium]
MKPRSLLWFPLALLLLLGCRLTDQLLGGGTADSLADFDVDPDQAIILSAGQPRTLDPALTHGGPDDALGAIFSGLVTLDQQLQVQPDLAAGWTISDDGLVYTFYLHKNAVFHDGRPVTAQDVIFSWERAADPATGSDTALTYLGDIAGLAARHAGEAESISGLQALDDHTLQVRLAAPVVYFLQKLAYPVAFVVDEANVARPDWEHAANGTGPFRLLAWRDDDVMVLARNALFYREPPRIEHLVYLLGANLPLALYEQGRIDMVGINAELLARVQDPNDPLQGEVQTAVSLCTSTIGMNNRLPPLDDPRVRQAFTLALDRAKLVDIFWHAEGLQAAGVLPPAMPGYGGVTTPAPFDPEAARALLAAAGYTDPAQLDTLTYYTAGFDDVNPLVTAAITLWQEELGVTIEPVLIDPFTYNDQLYAGDVGHFFTGGWCADYPDPQNFLDILYHSGSTQNLSGFSDPAVDALLLQARVEPDVPARLALYAAAEQAIVAQYPVIFLAHGVSTILVKPDVQNYVLTPMGVAQWGSVSKQ